MDDKLKQFEDMVNRHDLTYDYSDDGAVWRAGRAQRDAIRALAGELPYADVKRIWDAKVDRTLVPDARAPFYWK